MGKPLLFIISGPTGVGKTTLCRNLLARCGKKFAIAVTTTTRPPREGEVTGRDYYFVDRERFERMLAEDAFHEHSTVHGQHLYGLTKAEVQRHFDRCRDILLNADVQGATKLRRLAAEDSSGLLHGRVVTTFLLPPPEEELRDRVLRRGPMEREELERRIGSARGEVARASSYDYTIPAGTAEETLKNMLHIHAAEKMRNRS
ncbi:MAG: 50S ribosome-binding GTPase [Puniceicoccales bacterium]|jgi:guanylate kinase|nr:50S ribosome-binding GTPase [Puniceicoccales bacterium]